MGPEVFEEEVTQESPLPPPPLPGREDLSFLVLSGPCAGQYFRLPRLGGLLGRDPRADVRLTDPRISRLHARLERNGSGFAIHDLHSRYGTYVEGRRVQAHTLRDGDRVQLSTETVLRVRYQDAKETEILERLQDAIIRDALTGLANRRYFTERFDQEFAFARRHGTSLSVLMVDLDGFKQINDSHGHTTGDDVLRNIAQLLSDAVRSEDLVCRYGGDEFVVLSRGFGPAQTTRFAERLCGIARGRTIQGGGNEFRLTFSIGAATFDAGRPATMMELLARADSALYVAKDRGRDRAILWSEDLPMGPNDSDPTEPPAH